MPIYYKKYDINPQMSLHPPEFEYLDEVTSLLLEDADSAVIRDIQQYMNVESVEFTGKHVTKIPDWIFELPNLRILIIYNCERLEVLNIGYNRLKSITVVDCPQFSEIKCLHALPEITNVYFEKCPKLTRIPPAIMESYRTMTYFHFVDCDINEIPDQLSNYSFLSAFIIETTDPAAPPLKLPNLNNYFDLKIRNTNIPQLRIAAFPASYAELKWDTLQYANLVKIIKRAGGTRPRNTVITREAFIDDAMITNVTRSSSSPYLIHYESLNGIPYPIITIPRGTMLFSGRQFAGENQTESFSYMYKLRTSLPNSREYVEHKNLNFHKDTNYQDALTYFFPIPFMTNAVKDNFTNIDIVTCTQDIRLLCLISPSPISRSIRLKSVHDDVIDPSGNHIYKNVHNAEDEDEYNPPMYTCRDRNYDICLSNELIEGLKLNGYIGMPFKDSLTNNYRYIEDLMGEDVDLKTTSLFKSCVMNASSHNVGGPQNPAGGYLSGINSLLSLANYRTFGVPEIVLIPFNIHNRKLDYVKIYKDFMAAAASNAQPVPSYGFIFKPYHSERGANTFETATKIESFLANNKTAFKKSLQSYPLFTGVAAEIDTVANDLFVDFDYAVNGSEIMFPTSYETNGAQCKSAFETMLFYNVLDELFPVDQMTGGYVKSDVNHGSNHVFSQLHLKKQNSKERSTRSKQQANQKSPGQKGVATKRRYSNASVKQVDEITKAFSTIIVGGIPNGIRIKKPGFYYSEKSGFPVLCMGKSDDGLIGKDSFSPKRKGKSQNIKTKK